jgi:hypothetical protein
MELTKRILHEAEDLNLLEHQKKVFFAEIELMKAKKKKEILFKNQLDCAREISNNLTNLEILSVLIIALTQSGKTGLIIALIRQFYLDNKNTDIMTENIYIITGLSDVDWKNQTADRLPGCLKDRVYHRNNLLGRNGFVDDIQNKTNVLIIIDEIQVAAKEEQTIHRAFRDAGLMDKQYLFLNDIKIVQLSATPDGVIIDSKKWGECSTCLKLKPGPGHLSCFDLLQQNRCHQSENLYCTNNKKEYDAVASIQNTKRYLKFVKQVERSQRHSLFHIIRADNGERGDIIKTNFKKCLQNITFMDYDQNSQIDLDEIMLHEPIFTTIIFIKEKLRCSKTIENKDFLGSVYERKSNKINDSCIIQGLLGRVTGYNCNDFTICFTDIKTIKIYQELWNSNFESNSKWNSNTTVFTNGKLKSRKTFQNPTLLLNSDYVEEEEKQEWTYHYKTFSQKDYGNYNQTVEASRKWILTELKDSILKTKNILKGPNKKTTQPRLENAGWIYTKLPYKRYFKRSLDEVLGHKKEAWHKSGENKYQWKASYEDPNNINSFVAIVFYRLPV